MIHRYFNISCRLANHIYWYLFSYFMTLVTQVVGTYPSSGIS
jgi:hypothetical protein